MKTVIEGDEIRRLDWMLALGNFTSGWAGTVIRRVCSGPHLSSNPECVWFFSGFRLQSSATSCVFGSDGSSLSWAGLVLAV